MKTNVVTGVRTNLLIKYFKLTLNPKRYFNHIFWFIFKLKL